MLLVKEPHHLRRGVGAFGVGVGAGAAPSRPGVSEAVDGPLLHDGATVGVALGGAGVSVTRFRLSTVDVVYAERVWILVRSEGRDTAYLVHIWSGS